MRVLVLSNLYPPNALGGYEMSCRDVVERWRAAGHDVVVLTTAETVRGTVEPAVPEPHVRRELRWWWHEHRFVRPPWRERLRVEKHDLRVLTG
ncbi:MAG: glycogen synthase, partial [Frankiales bacterium]|nr:glycogen synthase [Frankiales bacterium]